MAKASASKKPSKSSLIDMAAKLPLAAKAGIVLGSVVLAGALFYMMLFTPYSEEKARLDSAIATARNDLNTQQAALRRHQSVAELKQALDWSYEYMQQYLPQETEMPRLVQMVSEIGARAGLSDGVTLFAPKLPAKVQINYAEIPFSMKLQGEFNMVVSFLYDFSRMNRIVNITEVKIGTPKMVDDKREILHISVDCSGSTYRSLTDEEIEAASKPDPKRGRGRS